MEAEVVLRIVTRTAHHLGDLAVAAAGDFHARPDGRAVRARTGALDQDGGIPVPAVVAQQRGRSVEVVHDDVHVAVVVEIAEGAPPAEVLRTNRGAGGGRHVGEAAVAGIAVENLRLPVREVQFPVRDLRVDVTVGDEDIHPAVVVEVEEVYAEAQILSVDAEAGPDAGVLETAAVVPVKRRHLLGEVRPHDIQPAVGVVIADAGTHAGERDAILVERASGRNGDLPERPVVIIAIEQTRRTVAGDVDVGPSVVVEIGCRRSHAVRSRRLPVTADEDHRRRPARASDPRRFRHVGECAVAAVAIEDIRAAGESQWSTRNRDVVVATVGRLTGPRRRRRIEIHIVGDEQIEMAVAVVIQKAAARAPARSGSSDSGLFRDVGKRAVTVVVIEHVPAPVGDEQIVEAVVVVIADTTSLAPA